MQRGGGVRGRLTKKGQHLTGLTGGVQDTGGRLKGECTVLVLKKLREHSRREGGLQATERERRVLYLAGDQIGWILTVSIQKGQGMV